MARLGQVSQKVEEIRIGHHDGNRGRAFGKIILLRFVICCFVPGALGKQAKTASAKIEGTLFVRDSAGNQSLVAGATVKLNGPATVEAENDANYDFEVIGTELVADRSAFVLEIKPKRKDKYLFRGRIWVDSEDYALVRAEGNPAKNPSFWTKSTHFVQVYQKSGRLWFPLSTQSVTEAHFFGTTGVSIEYFDYAPKASHPPDNSIMSAKGTPKP